eukprot:5062373-Lingulodinium_polyedra.AAC.1
MRIPQCVRTRPASSRPRAPIRSVQGALRVAQSAKRHTRCAFARCAVRRAQYAMCNAQCATRN